jgi:hypothetical protein
MTSLVHKCTRFDYFAKLDRDWAEIFDDDSGMGLGIEDTSMEYCGGQWVLNVNEYYVTINVCPFCGKNLGGLTPEELGSE